MDTGWATVKDTQVDFGYKCLEHNYPFSERPIRVSIVMEVALTNTMATEKKQIKLKVYSIEKEIAANDKCPPQARLIVETIKTAGGKIERSALIELLKRPPEQGGLKTNQTAERILGFYKPKLTEMGVLKEDVETKEIEVEVPDKPVKAEKPATEAPAAQAAEGEGTVQTGTEGQTAPTGADAPAAVQTTHSKEKGRKGTQSQAA